VFFQFAANAGEYEDEFAIQKHKEWPDLYKACDLRENCAELSFEKREKKRKNKGHKKEESTTPSTDESHDESHETTVSSEEKKEGKLLFE
jgi:hypothetical protein